MKTHFPISRLLFSTAFAVAVSACSTTDDPAPQPLTATKVSDLAADPTVISGTGQPLPGTNKFTLFSFASGKTVANADSASTKWDLGFRGTTLIVNGGTSGPGQGAALIQSGIFDELKTAPTSGYAQDAKPAYAIPTGSDKGWYTYNPAANLITPIAGEVIFLKTAEGKYAKLEILSYYKGAPAQPTQTSEARHYTFRYVYQSDGSTKLE